MRGAAATSRTVIKMAQPQAILFSSDPHRLPDVVRQWFDSKRLSIMVTNDAEDLKAMALRGRPRVVICDARSHPEAALEACRRLKSDPFSGVVPCAVLVRDDHASLVGGFDALADEVVRSGLPSTEIPLRLDAMLRRADRDVFVHPSTRLPGAPAIESAIEQRIAEGSRFGVCYADLDHFKEYNDRYSYYEGDRVIRILATILHDVVSGLCEENGFVGHIGGDDFIFIVPVESVSDCCEEMIQVFDAFVPYQYSEQDRRAGYYFGKDRRGQLHRVPLMTVSIGVVTNSKRIFTHASHVSDLATEMKSYAKTLQGSVYVVDRRQDPALEAAFAAPKQ
ncbi:MAG: diguanylate cyclase [Gemmatimonadaceae bacterium]